VEPSPTDNPEFEFLSDDEAAAVTERIAAEAAARTLADPGKARHGQALWIGYELRRRGINPDNAPRAARHFCRLARPTNPTGQAEPFGEAEALGGILNAYKDGAAVTAETATVEVRARGRTPVPLLPHPVAPFPVEVLPAPLARLVREASAALPCPPDFVAVPMLAALGAAIGTARRIRLKPRWTEGPRIYVAVIGDPGSKKSPALDVALAPLHSCQLTLKAQYQEAQEEHHQQQARFEVEQVAWKEAVRKHARGQTSGPREPPKSPAPPVMSQVFTTDATLEALGLLLSQNSRGLLFVRDELAGWVRSMNQYRSGKGDDRQKWLSFWSGAAVIVNRKSSREPIVLADPFLCVAGCLPPDVLNELTDERGREDGFVHRLLFAYPDTVPPAWTEASISVQAEHDYAALWQRLRQIEPAHDETGQQAPVILPFTPGGQAAFVEWAHDHHSEMAYPLFPAHLLGPWSKLEGYCARLALILHLCRVVAGEAEGEEIDEISTFGAAELVDYFKTHARRAYASLRATKEDQRVVQTIRWLRKQAHPVTVREMVRHNVAGVRTTAETIQLLRELEERSAGTLQAGSRADSLVFHLAEALKGHE
jgi:hypothetical protein